MVVSRSLLAALVAVVAACTTVARVATPANYISAKQPAHIWVVTDPNQRAVTVDAPRVIGDTILGTVDGVATRIPLADGSSVRAEQFSVAKTLGLVLVSGAAVATGAALWRSMEASVSPPSGLPCRLDPGQPVNPVTGCDY